jgi:transporter family protein
MTWFFLSLSAAFSWAIGQIFVKKGFTHIRPLWNNIFNNILSIFIWIPFILVISGFRIHRPSFKVFSLIFFASSLYHVFYYAISKGQISLTGTIIAGYPAITMIFAFLFLNERLTYTQYAGIACILSGGIVVALPEKNNDPENSDMSWIFWGFAGAFTIGTGDFLTKIAINDIGSYSYIFYYALLSNVLSALNYVIDGNNRALPRIFHRNFLPTFLGLIIHLIGVIFFYLAFDYGKISLIAGVSAVYPAFVVLLAMKFLKESISLKQGLGIGIVIAGLIVVGFGSG